jgi:retron-type reverse transcriptase
MVVKRFLEPLVEPKFHRDSYGYRPGKSALEAVGVARQRCWRYAWVLDLDIKAFFDSIDRTLLMRAVRKQTDCPWVLLYIERWLSAPVQMEDGRLVARERGTPQGGVASPLLANLFLHYAFDEWMRRNYPAIPFERYADDGICHCQSEEQARTLRAALDLTDVASIPTGSSTSSAIRFGRGWRGDGRVGSAFRSVPRPATKRLKRSGPRFAAGTFRNAVTSRWMTWLECSTP